MNLENSDDERSDNGLKSYQWTNLAATNKYNISDSGSDTDPKESKKNSSIERSENGIKTCKPLVFKNKVPSSPISKIEIESEINFNRSPDFSNQNKVLENARKRHRCELQDCSCQITGDFSGFSTYTEGDMCINRNRFDSKSDEINKDWGKRVELHKILDFNEGNNVWNFVSRGIFGDIKLWKNDYGHICCKASGKISMKGATEKSLIEINTEENLRKLLNLSHMQWSTLCEAVNEKDYSLNFKAFLDVDVDNMSSLEKLWFFTCKRRHFLPNICILGKLSGAVKVMKELRIMPKIVVMNIRDFKGEEIS